MSLTLYPLFQFTPIPFINQTNTYILNDHYTLYTKKADKNIITNNCVRNKNYYCQSDNLEIKKCLNDLIVNHKNDDCSYLLIENENSIEQIPNSNEIIIVSPKIQSLKIHCNNNEIDKKIKGIYQFNNNQQCTLNNYHFNKVEQNYKELIYEGEVNEIKNSSIQVKQLLTLSKLNITDYKLQELKPLNTNVNNHHIYVLYIIMFTLILSYICYKLYKWRMNKKTPLPIPTKDIELNEINPLNNKYAI